MWVSKMDLWKYEIWDKFHVCILAVSSRCRQKVTERTDDPRFSIYDSFYREGG
jgi:hypothetical protein